MQNFRKVTGGVGKKNEKKILARQTLHTAGAREI